MFDTVTIMGATASGKTALAVNLAQKIDAEIISADSRQVYRGLDIGTGKDLSEYSISGKQIPYHLIDIVDAGSRYNVFQYSKDFVNACKSIKSRGKNIILCGGSGMYIEAVIKGYEMPAVPPDEKLRAGLEQKTHEELIDILSKMKRLHNKTDTDSKKRTVRAIEIEYYMANNRLTAESRPKINNVYFELRFDRDTRRKKITERLDDRLKNGMVEEVEGLLKRGLTLEDMIYYGLEYKYIAMYLHNMTSYEEMRNKLEIAIHQFAKRQMTWFRGMERKGAEIHVIDASKSMEEKLNDIVYILSKNVDYSV
ncbi:MAG: tRNA (adenosine(37)-N6)-dimethylallyltransferase MiaA [Prevotellaceae bacterium]|jgi:tRNA dimethylallyltransferase|nr:tRNA (adenosine(37)-N6)-dimethylallyltransferase MiaA [Prevotellaceae bacterium]